MEVALKDINVEQIVTYTNFPLMLQAQVTKGNCAGLTVESLVWSCDSVNWQFWNLFGNNYTIIIYRNELQALPKNIDITMTIT